MATYQMPKDAIEHRNRYISGRIKKNLQCQEICYLYSKEGTRFQISKVDITIKTTYLLHDYLFKNIGSYFIALLMHIFQIVFLQTQRLRDILSSTLCCEGRCTGNSYPPEFFFPDISAVLLETIIKFFYTGKIMKEFIIDINRDFVCGKYSNYSLF